MRIIIFFHIFHIILFSLNYFCIIKKKYFSHINLIKKWFLLTLLAREMLLIRLRKWHAISGPMYRLIALGDTIWHKMPHHWPPPNPCIETRWKLKEKLSISWVLSKHERNVGQALLARWYKEKLSPAYHFTTIAQVLIIKEKNVETHLVWLLEFHIGQN